MRLRVLAICGCLAAASAHGATFTVTNLNDSGAGSLRQAIIDANAAPGADTIVFAAGVTGTITLNNTAAPIGIVEALTIQGPGSGSLEIDAGGTNRIFSIIEEGAPACPALTGPNDYLVSISGLTFRNGQRNVANSVAGAIFSAKSLTLQDVVFENNRARGGGAVFFSVQYPGQALTIANSRFTNNQAREIVAPTTGTHLGGAVGVAELCTGTRTMPVAVTIQDSAFSGNSAQASTINARGGAIAIFSDADVTIARSRIVRNLSLLPNPATGANAQGGGVAVRAGSLTVRDSEIADNESDLGAGMSLYVEVADRQTVQERMVATVVGSTVSGNRAYTSPAAVYAFGNVDLRLHNSTVVGNRSDVNQTGGVTFNTGATTPPSASNALPPTLTLESSILWNTQSIRDIAKNSTNMPGPLVVQSNNSLVGRLCDSICGAGPITLSGTGNQLGVDPLLGPLADNGGPTMTRLPQLGSPAINAGNNAQGLANDQRGAGFPRTIGAATDAGSTEYAYPAQCDGFADVAGNSPFCASVSWMKNRGVTLGCGGPNYCPDANVSRLSMAAFMKRLGDSLSGVAILQVQTSGALDFATAPVICQTAQIAVSTAPRRAVLDAVFAGLAGADSLVRGQLMVSEDNGATWTFTQLFTPRATFRAGQWRSMHMTGHRDVEAGKAVRFGVMMDRPNTNPSAVTDSTCRLRVRLENSAGFTPL